MVSPGLNYIAILVVTVISFVLGGLWYSPLLFERIYLAGIRRQPDELGGAAFPLALNFFTTLVTAIVFAELIRRLGLVTAGQGLWFGLTVGVGIIGMAMASDFAFNRFPLNFFLVEAGYRLLLSVIMGVILTVWR
jgi:hypothetical protein